MLFALAFALILFSAVCTNFGTPRAEPRLPARIAWVLGAAPLALGVWILCNQLSTFTAIVTVMTLWMIGLPVIGAIRAIVKRWRRMAND